MKRLSKNTRFAAMVGVVVLLITSCAEYPLNTMDSAGPKAAEINTLALPVFIVAGIVLVLVQGGILYMGKRFGVKEEKDPALARPGGYPDDEFPEQIHGNDALEYTWTAIPAVILAVVAVFTLIGVFKLDKVDAADDEIKVEVVGQQWWWEFQYHLDGNTDTPPDIVTANELVIPVNTSVALDVQSRDVVHSWWIPRLHGKRDAVPGRNHPWVIEADSVGRYAGQCTEFCGLSHAYMRMYTVAVTEAEFDEWAAAQMADVAPLSEGEEHFEGQEIFISNCAECHIVEGLTDRDGDDSNGVDTNELYDGDNKYTESLTAGAAPNLTHLMSRDTYAGSFFELYDEDGNVNRAELEAWVVDAPSQKPNLPENLQGMRAFPGLTDEQLEQLVDYLETLQ